MRRYGIAVALLAGVLSAAGCGATNDMYLSESRKEGGLVVILPGIEGESELNRNIRRGLVAAGVHRAIPIYNWGRPVPLVGMLANQVDFLGNRIAGVGVAKMIMRYQDSYPGRGVTIVGHSGGGGIAVFAAEAMPEDQPIDGLVLLSASLSASHDLTKALKRCRKGIVNFSNPDDVGLLGLGTTVVGNVDGGRGPSAGLVGFDKPRPAARPEKREAYRKLYQVQLTGDMAGTGSAHASTTRISFVSRHVAAWILADTWPAQDNTVLVADPSAGYSLASAGPRR